MRVTHSRSRQYAFTLVELMVALVLGSLVILAVTQLYLSSAQTQRLNDEQALINSKSLYALEVLERNIREAGFASCSPDYLVGYWAKHAGFSNLLNSGGGIYGYEHTGTGPGANFTLPGTRGFSSAPATPVPSSTLAGSDILALQFRNSQQVTIANTGGGSGGGGGNSGNSGNSGNQVQVCSAGVVQAGTNIQIVENIAIPQGTMVFFEKSCQGGDLFIKTNQSGQGQGNGNNTFTKGGNDNHNSSGPAGFCNSYNAGDIVTLSTIAQRIFYIAAGSSGEPTLFMQTFNNNNAVIATEEIISGVETMQISYGLHSAASNRVVSSYVSASNVTNWQQVISIRISLLLRSADNVLPEASSQSWLVNGTTVISPTDRRARVVLTSTTAIRSKTL